MTSSAAGEDIVLFEKQKRIYPKEVQGKYRRLRWIAMAALLGVYYLAPWIRWDRGEFAPDQAILIDMAQRRAYFFFIEIWPQEVYFLTGLLILAAIGLFFVTSLFGRVWCGYACPQTVWTDLFIAVERFIQGDRNQRIKLDQAKWSLEKLWKKSATHVVWMLIGLCTGGAWVFYFNDAPTLMDQILHVDVPWSVGSWIVALTASTYLMAGFAREQVCIYMCPYSRFQSAMFDKDTLIIGYDTERGEPRGKHKAGQSWDGRGHCIDCSLCVQVCPTGIDIRNGLQMQCIACGLCVDVCNNVMDKIGLPRGLIRYDTTYNQAERQEAQRHNKPFQDRLHIIRPRSIYYAAVLSIVSGVMLYGLLTRSILELHVLHERNPLYVMLSGGDVRNNYTIKILNKTHQDRIYSLSLSGLEQAQMKVLSADEVPANRVPVFADSVGQYRVQVIAEPQTEARREITFTITDPENGEKDEYESIFISR